LSLPLEGCAFVDRCRHAEDICHHVLPQLTPLGPGRAACHYTATQTKTEMAASDA
jgi:ABC-type dipeptide/oligopeptide/nickel transport system ATPase component